MVSTAVGKVLSAIADAGLGTPELMKCCVIAGGAALAFVNPLYTPSDVDVFTFGPDASSAALRIVHNIASATKDGRIVVSARGGVVTVWRPDMLPVQVVLTTSASAEAVIAHFDINVCKVYVNFVNEWPCVHVTGEAASFHMGATIKPCSESATTQTRRRLIKYVLAGFAPCSRTVRPITMEEIREYEQLQARTPKWHTGMTTLEMAMQLVYLGGIEFYWRPNAANELDEFECGRGPLADFFISAKVEPADFKRGGAYAAAAALPLASPGGIKPPHEVARLLAGAERAHTALLAVSTALASVKLA